MIDDAIPKIRVYACFFENDSSYYLLVFEIEVVKLIGIKLGKGRFNTVPKIIIENSKFSRCRSILLIREGSLCFKVNCGNCLCWYWLGWLEFPIMQVLNKPLIPLPEANIFVLIRIIEFQLLASLQLSPIRF